MKPCSMLFTVTVIFSQKAKEVKSRRHLSAFFFVTVPVQEVKINCTIGLFLFYSPPLRQQRLSILRVCGKHNGPKIAGQGWLYPEKQWGRGQFFNEAYGEEQCVALMFFFCVRGWIVFASWGAHAYPVKQSRGAGERGGCVKHTAVRESHWFTIEVKWSSEMIKVDILVLFLPRWRFKGINFETQLLSDGFCVLCLCAVCRNGDNEKFI